MKLAIGLVAAVALGATSASAGEDPAASAKRFVDRLYGNAKPPVSDAQQNTPELDALIARASRVAERRDDPDLVGDILCDCQDIGGVHARATVVSATAAAASVRVVLTGLDEGPAHYVLKLAGTPRGWRLADAVGPGGSYVAHLRRSLAGK